MDFLIEADELRAALAGPNPPLLLDTRKPAEYAAGHLPGAVNLSSYDRFVRSTRPADLALFRDEMAQAYSRAGVCAQRPVVVYEAETGMRAARELWILDYLGHPEARMLHGGLRAWGEAGGATTREVPPAGPTRFLPAIRDDRVISADEVLAGAASSRVLPLDVRDADEFAGRDHTACCARRGHVPGARWMEWTEFLDPDTGRYRTASDIRARMAARGIPADRVFAPYCHRGARSANTYYALRLAGFATVRNFIGSFHEWSAREELPVEA